MRITARDILDYHPDELWDIISGDFELLFDDGVVIQATEQGLIFSSYIWYFHRVYHKLPLLSTHYVDSFIKGGVFDTGTHLNMLGALAKETYDIYRLDPIVGMDQLRELIYEITNDIYCAMARSCGPDVGSLDILDFMAVINHPVIKKLNDECGDTPKDIEYVYAGIKNTLLTDPELSQNPIAISTRTKVARMGQVLQCVGPRGFVTDMDSKIFKYPIKRGFVHGFRKLYDAMIESRSAAKSHDMAGEDLQDSEYFSRKVQLTGMAVQNLHHCDCGSQEYLNWYVSPALMQGEKVLRPCDLDNLIGKYYLNEETGQLQAVTRKDKHLIGTTIKLRSVIKCAHPDPAGICTTCFGELSHAVPSGSNIGHMCTVAMTGKSSQSILSVKHEDTNAMIDPIILSYDVLKYLNVGEDSNSYLLSDQLANDQVQIVVRSKEFPGILDMRQIDDLHELNITRVTKITSIYIHVKRTQPDGRVVEFGQDVKVSVGHREASFTYDFLDFLRKNGDKLSILNDENDYLIDLSGWDREKVFMTLPLKHINMSDHAKEISELLESSVGKLKDRDNAAAPPAVLVEFFELVNSKLSVNLAVLEVTFYGNMIVSAADRNYNLPKVGTDSGLGVHVNTMRGRSLGTMMAFEYQAKVILDPASYVNRDRPDSVMDELLLPYEVGQARKAGLGYPPPETEWTNIR